MKLDDVTSPATQQTAQSNTGSQKPEKLTFWQRIANFFKNIF